MQERICRTQLVDPSPCSEKALALHWKSGRADVFMHFKLTRCLKHTPIIFIALLPLFNLLVNQLPLSRASTVVKNLLFMLYSKVGIFLTILSSFS